MNINEVSIKRLYTYGQYQNISFGYTATVNDGENADTIKAELLEKIEGDWKEFRDKDQRIMKEQYENEQAGYELSRKRREIVELEAKIDKMVEFLKSHGVDMTSYELPF